jgi:hypothetical protein
MGEAEKVLLEALLDAFDRLYDRECGAVDVHALLQATRLALKDSPLAPKISEAAAKLATILRSRIPPEQENSAALDAVDPLRRQLADLL